MWRKFLSHMAQGQPDVNNVEAACREWEGLQGIRLLVAKVGRQGPVGQMRESKAIRRPTVQGGGSCRPQ